MNLLKKTIAVALTLAMILVFFAGASAFADSGIAVSIAESGEDELGRMKEELFAIQSKISQKLSESQNKAIQNEPDTENDEYYSIMEYMQRRGRNRKMT